MRSASRAACAAASAPFGAGVLGCPTSRWITVSPAASFSAAAAITSMTMNGSTVAARLEAPRREALDDDALDDIGRPSAFGGEQRQPGAGWIVGRVAALRGAADAVGTGDGIDEAA